MGEAMATQPTISFAKFAAPSTGAAILLAGEGGAISDAAKACDPGAALPRAFSAVDFKGKFGGTAEILAPAGSPLDRIAVIGVGKLADLNAHAWLRLGGVVASQIRAGKDATVVADLPGHEASAADIAELAAGIMLRSYAFDKYRTRKNGDEEKPAKASKVVIQCAQPAAARKAFADAKAVTDGVMLARDLVNEPANTMGPVELANQAKALSALGVKVEILTEKEMRKLGMGALLGVAQGSSRPARLVVMSWNGGKPKDKPVVFVGKGVVFDTGGNSMKTASGMEDMKGDMGGSAAVIGAMHTLAARKAKANVIGVAGVVENMVDGNAQRPGDIVTSMSGQTIEVMNTDAEGRLVLADALWYAEQRFEPKAIIDLATLTGAVMVALGQYHAGLFSNDDALSDQLLAAGKTTHERLWRLPMGDEYDKLIDSKNADMKNVGGRFGGSISAAQFLKRFVKSTPWAHLDIAGTAMAAPATEFNQSWGTGFGVRLLDRYIRDNHES
jgi:leucyl aminopeptidase